MNDDDRKNDPWGWQGAKPWVLIVIGGVMCPSPLLPVGIGLIVWGSILIYRGATS